MVEQSCMYSGCARNHVAKLSGNLHTNLLKIVCFDFLGQHINVGRDIDQIN